MDRVETDGAFRTTDLALATVLVVKGYKHKVEKLNTRTVAWVFVPDSQQEEGFEDIIAAYAEYGCRVEPKSFIEEMARLRAEMYQHLNIRDRRRRAPSV